MLWYVCIGGDVKKIQQRSLYCTGFLAKVQLDDMESQNCRGKDQLVGRNGVKSDGDMDVGEEPTPPKNPPT